jgi:hypothetical protein
LDHRLKPNGQGVDGAVQAMRIVIFLGPSLPLAEAQAVCPGAIFLPPAAQADLLSSVGRFKPDIIGLIDGVFLQDLSVWHKEILYALKKGVVVIGASSMGALRAAETARYGTIGAGEIFRQYAENSLTDDDEVALVHGPAESGYRKFSEPMVNVRATFARAVEEGVIPAEALPALLAAAKAIHFTERTWPKIFAALPGDVADGLKGFVSSHYVDQKKLDALELLRIVNAIASGEHAKPEPVDFDFNVTTMFSALYHRDRTVESEGTVLPLYEIAEYAALHHPEFSTVNEAALDRALVGVLADLTGVEIEQEALDQEIARFKTERGLGNEAAFSAWLEANHLGEAEFGELAGQLAKRRRLHVWLLSHRAKEKNTPALLDQLRLRGEYPDVAAEAALHHHLNAGPLPEDAADTLQLAKDHVQETGISMRGKLADWSFLAGFRDLEDLRMALLRSKTARAAMKDMLASMGE